jgi:DnaK suppressor protein
LNALSAWEEVMARQILKKTEKKKSKSKPAVKANKKLNKINKVKKPAVKIVKTVKKTKPNKATKKVVKKAVKNKGVKSNQTSKIVNKKKVVQKPIKKQVSSKPSVVKVVNVVKKQPDKNTRVVRETKKMNTVLKVKDSYEDYMTTINKEHFRTILLNWKKQLLGEMERTVHHMQDDVTAFADPNDRATQEEEFSIELRTRDRERKLIKKIEEAITKLDNSDYGYCEDCGIEIGLKRLEARPTATLCIDCKTIEEIREKSSSD